MIYHKFQKISKKMFYAAFLFFICFSAGLLYDSIPDEIYAVNGEEEQIHFPVPVTVEKQEESVPVFVNHTVSEADYHLSCRFLNLIPVKEVSVHLVEKSYVKPGNADWNLYEDKWCSDYRYGKGDSCGWTEL